MSLQGGWMGDSEVGAGQIFQQVGRDLQWREQTQTVYSHRPDWLSSRDFPGEMHVLLLCLWWRSGTLPFVQDFPVWHRDSATIPC